MDNLTRCAWVPSNNPQYQKYHDQEWGMPVHDDTKLFEFLILEGAQAGLSWEIVLKKREGYKKAFHNFDIKKCANMTDNELEKLMQNPEIIRNRLKIFSVRKNAIAFMKNRNEDYKVELIEDLPEGTQISFYEQGEFVDLCAGPHLMSTKVVKAFKLTAVAGAYWRGSEKNKMLTRI